MESRCMACGTDLSQEVAVLRAAHKTGQLLAHQAWELVAVALVASGKPRDEALREAVELLAKAKGDLTLTELEKARAFERLERENLQLKHRLAQFTRVSGAAR